MPPASASRRKMPPSEPLDQRRGEALLVAVASHDGLLAARDAAEPRRLAGDQRRLHQPGLERRHGAAGALDARQLLLHAGDQLVLQRAHHGRPLEQVGVVEQVGLERHDLLQAQRPLLVPRPGQRQRLVPRRQLQRPAARVARQQHAEHLDRDAPRVVLRLLLGEPERVDLDAVPEPPQLRVLDAVPLEAGAIPQLGEGAHLAQLLHEPQAGVAEEGDAPDGLVELGLRERVAAAQLVQHEGRGGERVGDLLHRRGTRLLQVVGADVGGIEPRHLAHRVLVHVGDQPHGRPGREDVRAARQVLLDDVVLGRALQRRGAGRPAPRPAPGTARRATSPSR